MGGGGDTKKVAAVAGRRRWEWYGEGGSGGTEAAAVAAQRGRWQRHREGSGSSTKRSVAHRGWTDGLGSMSVWVGNTLGL